MTEPEKKVPWWKKVGAALAEVVANLLYQGPR